MKNSKGQMAVFIALIFQVLFVLFAMAINVGMLVHDKINLQSAVDLAAYYGAQRQAEILNAIAHQNYMVRQSYKLLSWRYRVWGTMGRIDPTPPSIRNLLRGDALREVDEFANAIQYQPMFCVSHSGFLEYHGKDSSRCHNQVPREIPEIPPKQIIAVFNPINAFAAILNRRAREVFNHSCQDDGTYNWIMAAAFWYAFKMDQADRRAVMNALARMAAESENDFTDLDGASVSDGVKKTFEKNLTFSNQQAIQNVQFFNGLGGKEPQEWLSPVLISPELIYMDSIFSGSCRGEAQSLRRRPAMHSSTDLWSIFKGDPLWRDYIEPQQDPSSLFHDSLGVEKNPWMMAYVGVKAETAPRQVFFPFGQPVTLKAKSYAMPFGGRIGPWWGAAWTPGANQSSNSPDLRIDGGTYPPRRGSPEQTDKSNDPAMVKRLLNYPRYPGDRLGLRSQMALGSLIGLGGALNPQTNGPVAGLDAYRDLTSAPPYYDPLAFDPRVEVQKLRNLEIAAIAPDLFDATYYSIEPNYAATLLGKLRRSRASTIDRFYVAGSEQYRLRELRADLGSRERQTEFSILDQLTIAAGTKSPSQPGGNPASLHHPEFGFFFIKDPAHLLTSWVSNEVAMDYSFPQDRFGTCPNPQPWLASVKVPGNCPIGGGRSGYSVRMVSPQYLRSGDLKLGGADQASGAILNPPPDGDGW